MTGFMSRQLLASGIALLSLAAQGALAQSPDPLMAKAQSQETVRVIVRLNAPFDAQQALREGDNGPQNGAIMAAQSALVESLAGVTAVDPIDGLPLTVLEVNADQLQGLYDSNLVTTVIEDELSAPTLTDSIPLIEADKAWARGTRGQGQTVAILDTGVDLTHPAFAGKIVAQGCYSTTSSANGGSVSLCPGGVSATATAGSGDDCSSGVSGCGHGSHVAGIAAGNGGGVEGVAKDAKIIALKVFSRFNSQSTCGSNPAPCALSYTSDQIKALNQVRTLAQVGVLKIASANMSLGGGKHTSPCDSDSRKPVIDQLRALGVATVISSGNSGYSDGVGAPGCISNAITVGSTTKSDTLSSFSNSHAMVDLLAPGQTITSARNGGGTTGKMGTSMSAPHVAGAFALHRSKHPGDSVTTIENKLKSEGKSVTGKGITKPRIDLGYLGRPVLIPIPLHNGPLALGTVWSNGTKQKGYGTWSSTYNATYNRYEISMTGQNYYYLHYATMVTPMDKRFCKTSSVSSKLLVYCYDHAGNPATSRFAFVTYKP